MPSSRKHSRDSKWLENPFLAPWLQEIPEEPTKFRCIACEKDYVGGIGQIYTHSNTEKHQREYQTAMRNGTLNPIQHIEMAFDDRVKDSEIRFAALIAAYNIPFSSAPNILEFFQTLADDVEVLKATTGNRNKVSGIISNVVDECNMDDVVETL